MNLTPADIKRHEALGITPDLLERAQVRRVDDGEGREQLTSKHRGDLSGVLYPYLNPITGRATTCRVRRDHPEMEGDRPRDKYLSAYGDRSRLFFSPGCAALLMDVAITVLIVEAEKSVLAVTCAAERAGRIVLAVGTGGCWGWKGVIGKSTSATGGRVGEKGPVADLSLIAWTGRTVVIAFDANTSTNSKVRDARRALAKELSERGAIVRVVDLPVEPGINGPDDFIGQYGDAAFFALVDQAGTAIADIILRKASDVPDEKLQKVFGSGRSRCWPGRARPGRAWSA